MFLAKTTSKNECVLCIYIYALVDSVGKVASELANVTANATEAILSVEGDAASGAAKPIPLPNEYLPSFWALLALAVIVVLHSLLWFAQRWSVKLRAFVQFRVETGRIGVGSQLLVVPLEHQGRAAIVNVERDSEQILFFTFQHQRFEIERTDNDSQEVVVVLLLLTVYSFVEENNFCMNVTYV